MDNFEKYAEFYDIIYQNKDYKKEAEFLRSIMTKLNIGKDNDILEIGCGTGKHLEYIANFYPKCTGIEPSEFMISKAHERVREKIYKQSAELLNLGKRFDFIYMLFHVFSYLKDIDEFFEKLTDHTNQGAIVCMDFWQATGVYFQKPELRSQWTETGTIKIHRIATPVISKDGSFVDVIYDIYVHDIKNREVNYFGEKHRMFVRSPEEVVAVAKRYGFGLLERCHLTKGDTPTFSDWDAGLVLKRL